MKIRLINDDHFEQMGGVKLPVDLPMHISIDGDGWAAVPTCALNSIGARFEYGTEVVLFRPRSFEIIDDTPAPKAIDERELKQLSKDLLCSMVSGNGGFSVIDATTQDETKYILAKERIDIAADEAVALAKALLERI